MSSRCVSIRRMKNSISQAKDIHCLRDISLSEYLIKFLQFYASFDVFRDEIHMTKGGRLERKINSGGEFCLYSPIEPNHNIGGKSFRVREVFSTFKNRFSLLTNKNYEGECSILVDLLNPSKKDFQSYLRESN